MVNHEFGDETVADGRVNNLDLFLRATPRICGSDEKTGQGQRFGRSPDPWAGVPYPRACIKTHTPWLEPENPIQNAFGRPCQRDPDEPLGVTRTQSLRPHDVASIRLAF